MSRVRVPSPAPNSIRLVTMPGKISHGREAYNETRNKQTVVTPVISNFNETQQQRESAAADLLDNLVNFPNGDKRINSTANRVENEVDSTTFMNVISEQDFTIYKHALENNSTQALDFLTAKIFKIGGKDAINILSQAIFSDYFINPEQEFNNNTLQQVSSSFLGAVEHNCNLAFDINLLVAGIRSEKEEILNDEEKDGAVKRILDNVPEKYTKNIEPDNATHNPSASTLNRQQKTR